MTKVKAKDLLLGAHTSTTGGLHNALLEGEQIGASTVQIFTSNQRQWKGRVLSQEALDLWHYTLHQTGLKKIMSHDSYLINLGSTNPELLKKGRSAFREEVSRCVQLAIAFLNFHPGAAVGGDEQSCLDKISESLLGMEDLLQEGKTRLLLELTAGQGSSMGYCFEQLAYIIGRVKNRIPIGVCIDTCHVFAAGYDIRTPNDWDKTLSEFDRVIGLEQLYAFHVNDSQKKLGSRVDRHQPLGKGEIGLDSFRYLMENPLTRETPKYLETPGGPPLWKEEIALLRTFAEEK